MRAARNVVPVGLLLGLMLGGSGCTAIGLLTGSIIDAQERNPGFQTPAEAFGDLRTGEELAITLQDGSVVRGQYSAWEFPPTDEAGRRRSIGQPTPPSAETDSSIAGDSVSTDIVRPRDTLSLRHLFHSPVCLSVVGADGVERVPVRDIFRIQRERRTTYYSLILGGVGLLLDAIVIRSIKWNRPKLSLGVSF